MCAIPTINTSSPNTKRMDEFAAEKPPLNIAEDIPPVDEELAAYRMEQKACRHVLALNHANVFPSSRCQMAYFNAEQPEMLILPQTVKEKAKVALLLQNSNYYRAFSEVTGAENVDSVQLRMDDLGNVVIKFVFDDDATCDGHSQLNEYAWELFNMTIYGSVGMILVNMQNPTQPKLMPFCKKFSARTGPVGDNRTDRVIHSLSNFIKCTKFNNEKICDRFEGMLFIKDDEKECMEMALSYKRVHTHASASASSFVPGIIKSCAKKHTATTTNPCGELTFSTDDKMATTAVRAN